MTRLNDIRNRQLDRKDMARGVVSPNSSVADVEYLLNLIDKQQAKLNAMSKHKNAHDLVDQFLAERRESAGGYAPFTRDDGQLLHRLLYALDRAKFGSDPDGDTPLNWLVINRTKCQPHHYVCVPYAHKNLDGAFHDSLLNLETATKAVRECMWEMKHGGATE